MTPEDVCGSDDSGREWTDEEINVLWPLARTELLGIANALERRGGSITADQLRMACRLAQNNHGALLGFLDEVKRLKAVINSVYMNACAVLVWGYDPLTDAAAELPRAMEEIFKIMSEAVEAFEAERLKLFKLRTAIEVSLPYIPDNIPRTTLRAALDIA